MSAHTPGPWRVESDGSTVTMAGQCVVTAPCPDGGTRAEERANACLISAAPELLAALRDYLELEHATDTYCERCERHAPKDKHGNVVGLLSHRDHCVRAAAEAAIAKAEAHR